MSERPQCPIDHHSRDYAEHGREIHKRLRDECPVGWSDAHGGFWVVSRYDDIRAAVRNTEAFSSAKIEEPDGTWYGGAAIPHDPSREPFLPLDLDPPQATAYRTLITKWMAKSQVQPMRAKLAAYVDDCLDRVEADNRMDVVTDIGSLPAYAVTLVLGLDPQIAPRMAWPFNSLDFIERDTDEFNRAMGELAWVGRMLTETCEQRRQHPGDDNISNLVTARVNGELIPVLDCVRILFTIIGGGVATTTAGLSHCLDHIDRNPDIRRRLIDDPELIPQAVEEMLRLNPPVRQLARTVRVPVELDGVEMQPRDRALLSIMSANRDEREFDEPDRIDIDRENNRHLTFGFGVHRCAGIEVARAELELMISRILSRFPDFTVIRSECRPMVEAAHNDGYITFPIDLGLGDRVPASTVAG